MNHTPVLNIAIITNIIPSYRKGFYDRLFLRKDISVTVYCQEKIPGMNLQAIHNIYPDNVKLIKYISFKREKFAWQFIPWLEILGEYDVVFIMGNPRILSDVLFGSLLTLFNKKVVLWTQAHSYRANTLTEKIRLLWSRIFKFIFVYTDLEVDFLRIKGFKRNVIIGMNNGLDQKFIDAIITKWDIERLNDWRQSNGLENKTLLLSCARLDPKNKFEQVIQALPKILAEIPNLIWCIIGDGEERDHLETIVKATGLENNVRFVGAVYLEDDLAPWFLSSELLIHPAAIGLTLMHAFGYGLPVITHGLSELHNPEYAAFKPEFSGRNFIMGDIESLAKTTIDLLKDKSTLLNMKNYALSVAREEYNVDVMAERFVQIANIAFKN